MKLFYILCVFMFICINSCSFNENGNTAEEYLPLSFSGRIEVAAGLENYIVVVGITDSQIYVERDKSLITQIFPVDSVYILKNTSKINPGPNIRMFSVLLPKPPEDIGLIIAWLDINNNGKLDFPSEEARLPTTLNDKEIIVSWGIAGGRYVLRYNDNDYDSDLLGFQLSGYFRFHN